MARKRYPKVEYLVVLLIIFAIGLFLMPFSTGNTRQAFYISKWNEVYNKLEYTLSVINAHVDDDMLKSLKKAETTKEKEKILLMIIKPYLRIDTENVPPKHYKVKFKNGNKIPNDSRYYFDELYYAKSKNIVGIKNVNTSNLSEPFFIMMFDINGLKQPNRWGVDVFGINIYDKGRIEPFGQGKALNSVQGDCSKTGTGIDCSYYYIIGGEF